MNVTFLDPQNPNWGEEINSLRARLKKVALTFLFPAHFLQVILPKIGGHVALFQQQGELVGAGFLFPRRLLEQRRDYTLRFHLVDPPSTDPQQLVHLTQALLPDGHVYFYDPAAYHAYQRTSADVDGVDIGRPDEQEAVAIGSLYQRIWGSPRDALYPADMHSLEFGLGTSLVARVDGELAGFLFGFYKFAGTPLPADWAERFNGDWRLESQTMGVLPSYRGRRIGSLLKKVQAQQARRQGIGIINWTADPLQYPNAALNFSRLRAIAFEFHSDYYPLENELNRLAASRFALTWLVQTERVQRFLEGSSRTVIVDVGAHPSIVGVNRGWTETNFDVDAPLIAIEIPADWTALQHEDLDEARRWREATDGLLAHYVGREPGKYIVTSAGVDDERRYLVCERVDRTLLERLSR